MKHISQNQVSSVSFALSTFLHITVMVMIFLSLVPLKNVQKFLEKKAPQNLVPGAAQAPTISAPVILYSGPIDTPHTAPLIQAPQNTASASQQQSRSTSQTQPLKKETVTPQPESAKPDQESDTKNNSQSSSGSLAHALAQDIKKAHEKISTKKADAPTILSEPKKIADAFSLPDKPFSTTHKQSKSSSSSDKNDSVRKRSLTLADLFKNMPHTLDQLSKETASSKDGKELVVVQGDMKYYSFLKEFLTHINQVFAFHGGPQKMDNWARAGLLKHQAGLSVTINKQGKVIGTQMLNSSGHTAADTLLLEAINLASPFAPVPHHFGHETVRVELISVI